MRTQVLDTRINVEYLDNSNRQKYTEGIKILNKNFKLILNTPVIRQDLKRCWETSIWVT